MKIAYHQPSLDTINAHRTIYNGFKNAFLDLGHEFRTYTAGLNLKKFLEEEKPDIFISSSHFFWRKQIDYEILRDFRKKGLIVFCKIDFWNSPIKKTRVNEAKSLSEDREVQRLIKLGLLTDHYFHVVEQGDRRMEGFEKFAGKNYLTIPLAVDKTLLKAARFEEKFKADISFIGSNLSQKRKYLKEWLKPLAKNYDLKLYGQDWTLFDRTAGKAQKVGQYFNLPVLKSLRKPRLALEDEFSIYASSKLCVNLHENYQREFGGDCNERTFKIPAVGCFEIVDNVDCISKYFVPDQEIIIAENKQEWFEKIEYYIGNLDKAAEIAHRGKIRTLNEHTYHHRVRTLLSHAF